MTETQRCAARAKNAARTLAILSEQEKNAALRTVADALDAHADEILTANADDLCAARAASTGAAMLDRLTLTRERIAQFSDGMRQVADLPDPIGQTVEEWDRPNGLHIKKIRVPIGVIGIIYEARPNVTVDCAALALKSGNAVVLRGSGSALRSNTAIVRVMQDALAATAIPAESVGLITDPSHDSAQELMELTDYIDLLIPRGGAGLIRRVVESARVPVMQTGVGNCHIFVDAFANPEMARSLVLNAKTQRPAVCNAAETLLISRDYPCTAELLAALHGAGVTVHGDADICAIDPTAQPAGESDYADEYLSLDLCVALVDDIRAACDHIARYGTGHTELIITENSENAEYFIRTVDAACVNHNASTRFTDGGQFGFGAEIGISTQKLHARGPLGLRELTIYKYVVNGNGQVRE